MRIQRCRVQAWSDETPPRYGYATSSWPRQVLPSPRLQLNPLTKLTAAPAKREVTKTGRMLMQPVLNHACTSTRASQILSWFAKLVEFSSPHDTNTTCSQTNNSQALTWYKRTHYRIREYTNYTNISKLQSRLQDQPIQANMYVKSDLKVTHQVKPRAMPPWKRQNSKYYTKKTK